MSVITSLWQDVAKPLKRFTAPLLLLLLAIATTSKVNALEVIVNSNIDVKKLSKQQLKAIYLGQQSRWSSGAAIKRFVFNSNSSIHHHFVVETLGLYPYQFNRRWQKLVFSGFAIKPVEVSSPPKMLDAIASTPGSIGYVKERKEQQGVSYVELY